MFHIEETPSIGSQCFKINTDQNNLLICNALECPERGGSSTSKINSVATEYKFCCTSSHLIINSSPSSYAEGKASQQLSPKERRNWYQKSINPCEVCITQYMTDEKWVKKQIFLTSTPMTTALLHRVKTWLHDQTTKGRVSAWLLITVGVLTTTENLKCPSCPQVFDYITEFRIWIIHTSVHLK